MQIRQAFQTSSLPPPSSAAIYINSLRHTWTIRVKVKVKSGINSIIVYHQFWVTIDTRRVIRMYKGCRSQVPPVGQNRSALTSTAIILARVQSLSILSIGHYYDRTNKQRDGNCRNDFLTRLSLLGPHLLLSASTMYKSSTRGLPWHHNIYCRSVFKTGNIAQVCSKFEILHKCVRNLIYCRSVLEI